MEEHNGTLRAGEPLAPNFSTEIIAHEAGRCSIYSSCFSSLYHSTKFSSLPQLSVLKFIHFLKGHSFSLQLL